MPKEIEDDEELKRLRESESEESIAVLGSIENLQAEVPANEVQLKGRLISDQRRRPYIEPENESHW